MAAANPDLIQNTDETEKTCWFYKYAIDSPENHEKGKEKKTKTPKFENIREKKSRKKFEKTECLNFPKCNEPWAKALEQRFGPNRGVHRLRGSPDALLLKIRPLGSWPDPLSLTKTLVQLQNQ